MGIKRCPYCRALVEEDAFYCRNCGTQLLFPEDEDIEENIPGDKIFEKPDEGERPISEEEREREKANLEEQTSDSERRKQHAQEKKGEGKSRQYRRKKDQEELKNELAIREEEDSMTNKEKTDKEKDEGLWALEAETEMTMDKETAGERDKETLEFPTAELNRLTRSVDEGQKKLEEFLEFLKEKASNRLASESQGPNEKEPMLSETAELPPWAEAIKDKVEAEPSSLVDLSPLTPRGFTFENEEERELSATEATDSTLDEFTPIESPPPWQADSGIGLPEKPGQQPLPFIEEDLEEGTGWREEKEKGKMGEEREEFLSPKRGQFKDQEEEIEEELDREVEKPVSRSFFQWIKAKLFDLIFVGLLWFIAYVLAARILDWPFFALVAASGFQAAALFLLLFGGYLFLFRFFIGETLGDRLFSPGE